MSELSEDTQKSLNMNQANIFDLISQLNIDTNETVKPVSRIPRFGNLLKQEHMKKVQTNLESSSNYSITSSECVSQEDTTRPSRVDNSIPTAQTKRGVSVSNSTSFLTKPRTLSCQASNDNLSLYSDKSDKKVRYLVKHRPKSSQVKIFSQKVEIKNAKSKINSLEKANYVPGGGNVVIETKPINWEAKSKINSLDKFNYEPNGGNVVIESRPVKWEAKSKIGSLEKANYLPSGGNVKIVNHKLNWETRSKINSLEKANYTPQGGNVKITSFKLDFKEKARSKTDTGLIVVEDYNEEDVFSQTSDLMDRSLQSLTGSN